MDDLFRIALSNAAWAAGLALVAATGSHFFRRRPALAHTLWLLVLLKLVTPPILTVAPPWGEVTTKDAVAAEPAIGTTVAAVEITSPGSSNTESPAAPHRDLSQLPAPPGSWSWRSLTAFGWLAGAVVWWAFVAICIVRFRRLLGLCIAGPEALQERIRQLAIRIGLGERQLPLAVIVPARVPPFVWASLTGRPRLLLPQALWDRLDESQQNALLAHELAHLKRGDHWVRWLEAIVLGLYWWDPIAWLARRELERTEEESCDAWVVWSQPSAAGSYAEALVATTAFLSEAHRPLPLGASGVGKTVALKRRLAMLFCDVASPALGRLRSRKSIFLAAACLPLLPVLAAGKQRTSLDVSPREESKLSSVAENPAPENPFTLGTTRLRPAGRFNLKAQVDGPSQRVRRPLGLLVENGDGLLELDPTKLELLQRVAESALNRARAQLRLRVLEQQLESDREHGIQTLPARLTELNEAEKALKEATAARDVAKLKLEAAHDPAPFNGTIEPPIHAQELGNAFALLASKLRAGGRYLRRRIYCWQISRSPA